MKIFDSLYETLLGKYGYSSLEPCSEEECKEFNEALDHNSPLPADITKSETQPGLFLRQVPLPDYDEAKKVFYLGLAQDVKTIKNCIIFFTVLTVIGLVSTLILYLKILSIFS